MEFADVTCILRGGLFSQPVWVQFILTQLKLIRHCDRRCKVMHDKKYRFIRWPNPFLPPDSTKFYTRRHSNLIQQDKPDISDSQIEVLQSNRLPCRCSDELLISCKSQVWGHSSIFFHGYPACLSFSGPLAFAFWKRANLIICMYLFKDLMFAWS